MMSDDKKLYTLSIASTLILMGSIKLIATVVNKTVAIFLTIGGY